MRGERADALTNEMGNKGRSVAGTENLLQKIATPEGAREYLRNIRELDLETLTEDLATIIGDWPFTKSLGAGSVAFSINEELGRRDVAVAGSAERVKE